MSMIPDESVERIIELWVHLFEGLEGYLVSFTGQQSARTDARPNELDAPQQRSWRWPTQQADAAEYLYEQSQGDAMLTSGSTSSDARATARRRTPRRS